ncbi:hypothetical protein WCW05_004217 [Escherichia coli]|uniref:hypothetical protein n=1 Tax=Escherichia coli TaxID=562 RepID=UPI000BE548CD|nr:hypothetical protein [Escherichia coli]
MIPSSSIRPNVQNNYIIHNEGLNIRDLLLDLNARDIGDKQKDSELSCILQKMINPSGGDGNCSGCALHACMALLGYGIREAPASNQISEYMTGFFNRHHEQIQGEGVVAADNQTYDSFRKDIENHIITNTEPESAVMLSIEQSAHWIAAYNDGHRVWFLDVQTGQGFNLYDSVEKDPLAFVDEGTSVQIVKVSKEEFENYSNSESWKNKRIC